ncbi:4Fe-4S dicluster domain-containing protein [Curtanaerobium respiraculi]|uniref:4Fe-4S dicluster domain-containing protein n=1 Tax=Curtanaerobium respiraculi TaxID=2949669 RepID=UPI0024B37C46|nr:4Fe-4S dicluster domain-containing protein [Curtanaerobium respiraculi]
MASKFVIADPRVCVGCKACMAACLVKHYVPGDIPIARLNVMQIADDMTAPILCRHCEDAPCAAACPTAALYRDGDRVGVRLELCIGCRSCVIACPFGAVDVIEHRNAAALGDLPVAATSQAAVIKCDRCVDRPQGPACVEACTSGALQLTTAEDLQRQSIEGAAAELAGHGRPGRSVSTRT